MIDESEAPGFQPIGNPAAKIAISRCNSDLRPLRSQPISATIGSPLPATERSSSIGRRPGGAGAERLPPTARHSASAPPRDLPKDLRMRCDWGEQNLVAIASHISRLMAHYWVASEDARLRAALARDWLDDLAEFHQTIVAEACRDWRRSSEKRPAPAQIRGACLEMTARPRWQAPALPAPDAEDEAEMITRRQAMGERFGEWRQMLSGEKPWPTR